VPVTCLSFLTDLPLDRASSKWYLINRRRRTRLNGSREICLEAGELRTLILIVIVSAMALGCAYARTPVAPETGEPDIANQQSSSSNDPNRLWGEYSIFINAAHDKVDVVPKREARFHLNALKFLESYCTNCLKIDKIKNNGDGTVDLQVTIKHPFAGYPQYTGFDVKGIIMFNGSHVVHNKSGLFNDVPKDCRLSWRELGDPQVLKADGYVRRWALSYESGSNLPIFNYWKGKAANGEPNADVNAFLNFYTDEERHMFRTTGSVTRTYKLWLPKGKPVIAGYAVEACWEPPLKTPVIDPLNDFPTTANQPEAYYLKWTLNNGEPIKYQDGCCNGAGDCSDVYAEIKQWGGVTTDHYWILSDIVTSLSAYFIQCDPAQEGVYSPMPFGIANIPPGKYLFLGAHVESHFPDYYLYTSYDILEFETVD
jgi:hypothetical protein